MNIDMGNILRRAFFGALWCGALLCLIWAAGASRRERMQTSVSEVRITVDAGREGSRAVTGESLRERLDRSGVKTVGLNIDSVDLRAVERVIAGNGFVEDVQAYVSRSGVLSIEVRCRKPVVRLLFDGYDSCVDEQGYVFPTPAGTAFYLPVITGSYRPPFDPGFSGLPSQSMLQSRRESALRAAALEREKYPHQDKAAEWRDSLRKYGRRYISRHWMESEDDFARRIEWQKAENTRCRRRYEYRIRTQKELIASIEARRDAENSVQKKLEKNYEDFGKLITFVNRLEKDEFRRAETVQIVASSTPAGELEVELVPRSGNYVILFGTIGSRRENEEKFERLDEFRRKVLGRVGWDRYRIVNVKYKGQVVCSK